MTLKEMLDQRLKLVAEARSLSEKAKEENRKMNAEEADRFDAIMVDADNLKVEIDTEYAEEQRKAKLDNAEKAISESRGRKIQDSLAEISRGEQRRGADSYKMTLRGKEIEFKQGTPEYRRNQSEYVESWRSYLMGQEKRNLQSDLDVSGGFVVSPEQAIGEFIKTADDSYVIRKLARSFTINATAGFAPNRTAKMASAAWGGELTTPTDDTALAFGQRRLEPHYMTGSIKVSRDLIRSAIMPVEQLVMDEFRRDFGDLEENAFMTGTGAQRPLGLFTANANGISTDRDFDSTSTTAVVHDQLVNAYYGLKERYRMRSSWIMNRTVISQVRKITVGDAGFIWQPALALGTPDTILGRPVYESEFVPGVLTAATPGRYVGMIGDFSHYWIVDALLFEILVLQETAARTNQVEYVARRKVDAAPILEEAFSRLQLADG